MCGHEPAAGKTYLSVINLGGGEESVQRVVAGEREANNIDEELASDVEEDEEEVDGTDAEDGVDLGHIGLLLEVDEGRVLGQLESNGQVSLELERCSGDDGAVVVVACVSRLRPRTGQGRPGGERTSLSSCEIWCWAFSWNDMVGGVDVGGVMGIGDDGWWCGIADAADGCEQVEESWAREFVSSTAAMGQSAESRVRPELMTTGPAPAPGHGSRQSTPASAPGQAIVRQRPTRHLSQRARCRHRGSCRAIHDPSQPQPTASCVYNNTRQTSLCT